MGIIKKQKTIYLLCKCINELKSVESNDEKAELIVELSDEIETIYENKEKLKNKSNYQTKLKRFLKRFLKIKRN
jgi:hypothetical protein